MMPSEWAMKEARRHWERISTDLPFISLAEALDAVRAQGRREGLEEAAGIAEIGGRDDLATIIGKVIAADIRARIEEPTA